MSNLNFPWCSLRQTVSLQFHSDLQHSGAFKWHLPEVNTAHTLSTVFMTWCENQVLWLQAEHWVVVVKHPQLLAWEQEVTWLSPSPTRGPTTGTSFLGVATQRTVIHPQEMCSFVPTAEVTLPGAEGRRWLRCFAGFGFGLLFTGTSLSSHL